MVLGIIQMISAQDFMTAIVMVMVIVFGLVGITSYVNNKTEITDDVKVDENTKVLEQIDSLIEILKNPPIK